MALSNWKAAGKKGVWLKLAPEHAALLPAANKHGFEMHHANKQHLVLVKWLPTTPSTIPQPASHYVGVGVAVIDEQNRILVVQEKFGPASRRGKVRNCVKCHLRYTETMLKCHSQIQLQTY